MSEIKDELLFDFGVNSPRVTVTNKLAIMENVKKIVDFTANNVTIQSGKESYAEIKGDDISIVRFQDSRIICRGRITAVEFYER